MPVTNTGYISYTAEQSLNTMQQVFVNTFGNRVNLVPQTINGVFIQELTNLSIGVENSLQYIYSGVYNPEIAEGVFLGSIGNFLGISRAPATSSQATVQITGLAGTVIPANSQILNTNGDIFVNPSDITIGMDGTASGIFFSQQTGPIPVNANSLNRIVQNVNGWSTVNNANPGITGQYVQSDFQYRRILKYSKSLNSTGFLQALISALNANSNIQSFYAYDNYETHSVTVRGVTIAANSIYVSVYGGTDDEVAAIIASKKSPGAAMTGSTTVTLQDNIYPWVSYVVKFDRPTPVPVYIDIVIKNSTSLPANIINLIKQAILDNFNGNSTEPRVVIGDDFYSGRFYQSITELGVYKIISLYIGTSSNPTGTVISLPANQVATLDISNIKVTLQ